MRASSQQLLAVTRTEGPLYVQIYQRIRALILTGVWPSGTHLPSSRVLARDLGVSRNTAILALEKLVADGWVVSRAGSGMFVSTEAPPGRPHREASVDAAASRSFVPVPFEISEAATDQFDVATWSKIQRSVWKTSPEDALHEGAVAGWPPLRSAISSYLSAARGLDCSPEQVFILSGTQPALDLCARVLSRPSDQIWIEDPGYPYARAAFNLHGLVQVPVSVDDDGIIVEEGQRRCPRARLAYVTPACQFPTCVALSQERRAALMNWAEKNQGYILEDDWDSSAVFDGARAPEPIAVSLPQRTLFIHSFNRILFPALRIAALVVPESLVGSFTDGLFATARFQNVANQITLAHFIDRGFLSAHVRRTRLVAGSRRAVLEDGLRKHLWRWLYTRDSQRGFHSLAWIRSGSDSDIASAARAAGIGCTGLNEFVVGTDEMASALVLGFAAFEPDQIEAGLGELARLLSRRA